MKIIEQLDKEFIKEVEYKQEIEETAEMRIIIKELLHARDKALLEAVVKEIEKCKEVNSDGVPYHDDYNFAIDKVVRVINSFMGKEK
jgi:hypothetical protein